MSRTRRGLVCVLMIVLAVASGCRKSRQRTEWRALQEEHERPIEEKKDPFFGLGFAEEGTAMGSLQRFLEAWKRGDMDLMLEQCRARDRERRRLLDRYRGNIQPRLTSYAIRDDSWEIAGRPERVDVVVDIVGENPRTRIKSMGRIRAQLYDEKTPDGNSEFWRVDLASAMPEWMD